jgi:hypothetical protein
MVMVLAPSRPTHNNESKIGLLVRSMVGGSVNTGGHPDRNPGDHNAGNPGEDNNQCDAGYHQQNGKCVPDQ